LESAKSVLDQTEFEKVPINAAANTPKATVDTTITLAYLLRFS
jgi:hypothetical protein